MAKAQVLASEIEAIKQTLYPTLVEQPYKTLVKIEAEQKKLLSDLAKECEAILKSEHNSIEIGSRITSGAIINIDALRDVHIGLFHLQRLSAKVRVNISPKMISNYREALMLFNQAQTAVINSTEFDIFSSSAEKNRVCDYICEDIDNIIGNLKSINDQYESYNKFVNDQLFHLNGLDTMIRTADKMEASELFTEAKENVTLASKNKPLFEDDFELEDEDGLTTQADENKLTSKVKVKKEKEASEVDEEDFGIYEKATPKPKKPTKPVKKEKEAPKSTSFKDTDDDELEEWD